ncbi:MAG: hypothetical protein GXC94_11135 [Comamonadaceae bacterium]|nr:hypothetical protein [Comamonadaceae bacterium]
MRPDPAHPWDRLHPSRPQLLMLSLRGTGQFEEPMAEDLRQPDIAGLEALVRRGP